MPVARLPCVLSIAIGLCGVYLCLSVQSSQILGWHSRLGYVCTLVQLGVLVGRAHDVGGPSIATVRLPIGPCVWHLCIFFRSLVSSLVFLLQPTFAADRTLLSVMLPLYLRSLTSSLHHPAVRCSPCLSTFPISCLLGFHILGGPGHSCVLMKYYT